MRTDRGLFVVMLLWCACGPAPKPDAGGFGGGSAFGGGAGGGTGGGGNDTDAGTDAGLDAGTQDAGVVDAGPSETFRFRVVQGPGAQPVANVAIRIAGPSSFVDGYSDGNGDVVMALPGTSQRPLDLTLTRLDRGVLSIIGLTTEFPAQVRLDSTSTVPSFEQMNGTISGRLDGGRVVVDSFDFVTTSTVTSGYASQYDRTSGHPLPVVAFEMDSANLMLNWVIVDGGTRSSAKVINLALPSTPETPSSVPWSATFPDAGLLTARPVMPFVTGWRVVSSPTESWITTGSGSATATSTGFSGDFTAVTGPLAPNRFILELSDGASYLVRHRHPDLTPPISFRVPQVNQLTVTGAHLGDLAAAAAAPAGSFDTLCLTAEVPGSITLAWRVCTAPGAPFSVPRLPSLPEGLTPADLNVASPGTMLQALPLLIHFEDPAMRPWLLQNSTGPLDAFRDSFGGGYQTIDGVWR